MGKQIQIVGMNAPFEEKALDLETGNQFTFAKPAEGDAVEIGDLNFIRAIKNIDTFRGWTVNYKRSEDVVVVLKIDKIEKEAIDEDFNKFTFTFVNDDVDVSSIVLVKLVVEYNEKTGAIEAEYQDETKEIEAGTVLPTPSAEDDGRVLGVVDGAYALTEVQGGGGSLVEVDITSTMTVADLGTLLGFVITSGTNGEKNFIVKSSTVSFFTAGNIYKFIYAYYGPLNCSIMSLPHGGYSHPDIHSLSFNDASTLLSNGSSHVAYIPLLQIPDLPSDITAGGEYILQNASGTTLEWGTKLPVTVIDLPIGDEQITIQNILDEIPNYSAPSSFNENFYDLYLTKETHGSIGKGFHRLIVKNYGSMEYHLFGIPRNTTPDRFGLYIYDSADALVQGGYTSSELYNLTPNKANLDNTKTYVLKCVNGTLTWVEEQA